MADKSSRSAPSPEGGLPRLPFILACLAALLYALTFGTMGILQYHAGNISYTDTATFEEMLWRTLHGEFLMCTELPHTLLGSHVQLIHLLLLPVYVILPNLQTLMIAETVALAAGALLVYALAAHVLKNRWLGCAFAFAYILYTPLQMINIEGGGAYNTFRPITFAVPLLLAAFYSVVRGRLVTFSIFAFLTLLCKQEFGLILFTLGLYVAFFLRKRWLGLSWAGLGLVWFAVSVWVVIPHFRGGESHVVSYYAHLGGSAGEIIANALLHPLRMLQIAFTPPKPEFLVILFLPVGLLCLLSPLTLAIALPAFAICLLSSRPATYMPWFHYHTPIIPFVFIAAIYGMSNLARLTERRYAGARDDAPRSSRLVTIAAAALLLICSLGTNIVYSKSPLSFRFYDPKSVSYYSGLYVITPQARKIPGVVRSIPREKRVCASLFLNTYFTHHGAAYVFPKGLEEDNPRPADYVALMRERWLYDSIKQRWVFSSPEQRAAMKRLTEGREFERLPAPGGFLIFRRLPRGAPKDPTRHQKREGAARGAQRRRS